MIKKWAFCLMFFFSSGISFEAKASKDDFPSSFSSALSSKTPQGEKSINRDLTDEIYKTPQVLEKYSGDRLKALQKDLVDDWYNWYSDNPSRPSSQKIQKVLNDVYHEMEVRELRSYSPPSK